MSVTHRASPLRGWLKALSGAALLAAAWFAPAASAATGTCGGASSQGVNGPADYATYCWIDFANYNNTQATSAGGQAFTITLTGGSTLSFTLKVTGTAMTTTTVPTWTGAALGQSAFITIPGKPAIYQTAGGTNTVTLSNLVLTVGSGTVPYAIVAADAESTNNGESLSFTTNGNAWTLLASMAYNGTPSSFPTLTGVGTTTVSEAGVAGNVGAYAFATQGSPTTISSNIVGGGLQGIAFAVKFHAVDFAITSSHTGSFNAGGSGSYTLTATNNGPDQYSPTDTVTVTDTLPTGESYVSASGSGWSCGAVGQLVTCTATNVTVNSGSSLPAITLNVNVAANAAASLTNTATVASNPSLDFNSANNTETDVTTIVTPDLTTSTKTVVNVAGGDAVVGSTLQYTITLTESAGVAAVGASVTDDIPANLSGFTVTSIPSGSTNSSTGTGGANGDGFLNITGITVPANGSVTVVFTAQVKTGTATCTTIDNTATVTTPNGAAGGATPQAPTIVVGQSSCASSGNKVLYLNSTVVTGTTRAMSRQPTTTNTSIPINGGTTQVNWEQQVVAAASIVVPAQTVTVNLYMTRGGTNSNRTVKVGLAKNSAPGTVLGSQTLTFNPGTTESLHTFSFTISGTTVSAGDALLVEVTNSTTGTTNTVNVFPLNGTAPSDLIFGTSTVINVGSVTAYTTNYPTTTLPTGGVFLPGQTVFVCAVVSDPFGSADIDPTTGGTAPQITLTDPNGTVQVNAVSMTKETGGTCAGGASSSAVAFEYSFPTSFSLATGFWTASVTASEGTEKDPITNKPTITHTANGSFDLDVPSLLFMKTVLMNSDPVEGTTRAKAIPGAIGQYTVMVQNNGRGPVDSGTLVIVDAIPANTAFYMDTSPFTFAPGTSGLTGATINYSTNNGGSYSTTAPSCPVGSPPCQIPSVTNVKFTLAGAMSGKTGATAPSFTLSFEVVVK